MIAFFLLLFLLLTIYLVTSDEIKEGFNPVDHSPEHKINLPQDIPARCSNELPVKPYQLPGEIPIAPYEQIASMSPLPYQDTTLIKANRQQLINELEMLKGFLAFEAQEISERSDPTIQLPLNTARSDFHTLQAEVDVLNRNPGIQPTITLSHLNEISSNRAFLQQQVRLIGAAGPIQGPIYEFTQSADVGGAEEGFQSRSMDRSNHQDGQPKGNGQIATPDELKQFTGKLTGEITRLAASGTTDPVLQSRVTALTNMKTSIQDIVAQHKSGALSTTDIPVMSNDINNALKVMGNPSQPLPQVIKTLGLPAGLANVLPSNVQNDPAVTQQINHLVDKYADTIVNGLSASFSVKYTSPREETSKQAEIARAMASTVEQSGFPSIADLNNVSNAKFVPQDSGAPITDRLAPTPMDAGRGPSHFDWKTRAKQIEEQVKKRGLKPTDFGIMPKGTNVSNDFSWKGYARMMCTRLQTTMDPSLPETCGCPPMDWKGWRIAK